MDPGPGAPGAASAGEARKQTSAVSASREESRAQTSPEAMAWGVAREAHRQRNGTESEDGQGSPGEREEGHSRQRYDLHEGQEA